MDNFVQDAKRGETFAYYTGFLAADRGFGIPVDMQTTEQRAASEAGNSAWRYFQKGVVTLVQRKLGSGIYEYLAVKL